jgi:hypothetical protein
MKRGGVGEERNEMMMKKKEKLLENETKQKLYFPSDGLTGGWQEN